MSTNLAESVNAVEEYNMQQKIPYLGLLTSYIGGILRVTCMGGTAQSVN